MSSDQLCFVVAGDAASVETRARPTPKEGECLVKVLLVGVCNTDLEILKGYMGFAGVVGHEFVGRVETAPAGAEHLVGQRVVGDINLCCNQPASCKVCELGLSNPVARNHCPVRTVLGILNKDGCYAEYITLPVVNLHLVPPNVSTENAAFVEPLAAACRIVEQGLVEPCDRVAVVGDGKLGLLIAEVLGRHVHALTPKAPPLVLLGRHTSKMGLLSADAGVETALAADALPARAACFDVVVDATGSPAGLGLARQLLRPLGTLVLKSTCAAGADFNTAPFVVDELKVVGSRCGPFPPALKLLEGGLDLTKLIDATYPLAEAADAVAKAATKGTMKVQIRVSAD